MDTSKEINALKNNLEMTFRNHSKVSLTFHEGWFRDKIGMSIPQKDMGKKHGFSKRQLQRANMFGWLVETEYFDKQGNRRVMFTLTTILGKQAFGYKIRIEKIVNWIKRKRKKNK